MMKYFRKQLQGIPYPDLVNFTSIQTFLDWRDL